MLKKLLSAIIVCCISLSNTTFGMDLHESNQLTHIQEQLKHVRRSWQRAEMTLQKMRKQISADMYNQMEATAIKLLATEDITTKMNFLVGQQTEAIVNHNSPYRPINFLTDYFSEKISSMKPALRSLCSALANKEYRTLLGKKLTTKAKELQAAAIMSQTQKNLL